ncbi:MAG: carboxypeptidase-like regulatory domain-containing protein, partial [Chitinophagaceae bacterium]|nr:carboxypeptidase-like regulatory domain-containing protein [Chitinophagaceae bacterium]
MKSSKNFWYQVAYDANSLWRKRKCLLLSLCLLSFIDSVFSQENAKIQVTGTVTDSVGTGVPNVTVTERGTKNATSTSEGGAFTIHVRSAKSTLVFSSVGFSSREVQIGDQTNLAVTLNSAVNNDLGEVVVVGYGTSKKQSLTGAISTVTAKDIDRVHAGSTVSSSLAGKLPGVTFRMPDGRPGASANIQIRNMGEPLYV